MTYEIVLLSHLPNLESNVKFQSAAKKLQKKFIIVTPFEVSAPFALANKKALFLVRIGDFKYQESLSHLKKFDLNFINPLREFVFFRNKISTFNFFIQNKIPTPQTETYLDISKFESYENMEGLPTKMNFPFIAKLSESLKGNGVFLIKNKNDFRDFLLLTKSYKSTFLVQQFISECAGEDVRVFITTKSIYAIKRKNTEDFRSNLAQGGVALKTVLTREEKEFCVKIFNKSGLKYAGIDFLRSSQGPLFLEINVSPGFKGIENCYDADMATEIITSI